MADNSRRPSGANGQPQSETKTRPKSTSEEILEWARSFNHETPPMFRRLFEQAAGPKKKTVKVPQKLVDYESDSDEEPQHTRVIPSDGLVLPQTRPASTLVHQEPNQQTSVASDPGVDTQDSQLQEAHSHPRDEPPPPTKPPSEATSTSKYRINFGGPAYPTVQQPTLPDLTKFPDPNGTLARRLAKYGAFNADAGFLSTHLHPINPTHCEARFHTKFFVKTIGTIMCDQCKQKNTGEVYKCHTCTNQICQKCVEDRLRKEEADCVHGAVDDEPYKWEWNGVDRHEGFKHCYLERREKAGGKGNYSIPFVGVVDGEEEVEGVIEMVVSDSQSGRKRKGPPTVAVQQKVKLRAVKDEMGEGPSRARVVVADEMEDAEINPARPPRMNDREALQHMVYGKNSTALAKLTRIQEAANTAVAGTRAPLWEQSFIGNDPGQISRASRVQDTPDRSAGQAEAKKPKGYHPNRNETFERERRQQWAYHQQMMQAQMLPPVLPSYQLASRSTIPPVLPEAYGLGPLEDGRPHNSGNQWDGRGLPPYDYNPYRISHLHQGILDRSRGREQSPGVGPSMTPRARQDFRDLPHRQYGQFTSQYPMYEGRLPLFRLNAAGMKAQAERNAYRMAQQQSMQRMPPPTSRAGTPETARRTQRGFTPADRRPREASRPTHSRAARVDDEETAENIDPSSLLPDDVSVLIPEQYRRRSAPAGSGHAPWNALVEAASQAYDRDFNLDRIDGTAVGTLSPAQFDAVRIAASEGVKKQRESVIKKAQQGRNTVVVVIDSDEDVEMKDAESESETTEGNGVGVVGVEEAGTGRLRNGKEFT